MSIKQGELFYKILNSEEYSINGDLDKNTINYNKLFYSQVELDRLQKELIEDMNNYFEDDDMPNRSKDCKKIIINKFEKLLRGK